MPYRRATPEEEATHKSGGYRKATAAEAAQYEYDQSNELEKFGRGVQQSFTELGHGINDLLDTGAVTAEDRRKLEALQAIDDPWKTAGQVGGEIAQVMLPGGVIGKVASKGLPLAMAASRAGKYGSALAGDVLATGVTEHLRGNDGLAAAGTTTAVGAALPYVGKAAAKLSGPMKKGAQEMLDEGVRLTPGQARGGIVGLVEEGMSYIPGIAGGVRKLREQALKDWNEYIRTGGVPRAGWDPQKEQEAMGEGLGKLYDSMFKGEIKLSNDLTPKWESITRDVRKALPPREAGQVERTLVNYFQPLKSGTVEGKTLQHLSRNLAKLSKAANARGDQLQAEAYSAAREALTESMPKGMAEGLSEVNKLYADFKVMQKAMASSSASKRIPGGMITPNDLMTKAVAGQSRAASEGTAAMQDVASQGAEILGATMPSGSGLQRAASELGIHTAAAVGLMNLPMAAGAMAARGALVNPLVRDAMTGSAGSVGEGVARKGAEALAVGTGTQIEDPLEKMRAAARALRNQQ